MAKNYDKEQAELAVKIAELESFIEKAKDEKLNDDGFLKLVRRYTDIKELEAEIIRTFVNKIYVNQSVKVEGARAKQQSIYIEWNYIGVVDLQTEKSA